MLCSLEYAGLTCVKCNRASLIISHVAITSCVNPNTISQSTVTPLVIRPRGSFEIIHDGRIVAVCSCSNVATLRARENTALENISLQFLRIS